MSENSEIIKAIEELKSNQIKLLNLLLNIIEKLAIALEDEDLGTYYSITGSLLEDLTSNIFDSSNIISALTLAPSEDHECQADMGFELAKKIEKIFAVFNELKSYVDECLDNEDFAGEEYDECEDDDDEDLNSLLKSLGTQLIAFEENIIILVKLYNKNPNTQKLSLPNTLFSTIENLNDNPLIRQLINRGVEID